MEKELFNFYLSEIRAHFKKDDKEPVFISLVQAAEYCGKDRRTLMADKTFPLRQIGTGNNTKYSVPVASLARWLS